MNLCVLKTTGFWDLSPFIIYTPKNAFIKKASRWHIRTALQLFQEINSNAYLK